MFGIPLLLVVFHGSVNEIEPLTTVMLFGLYATYSSPLGPPLSSWWIMYGVWALISCASIVFVFLWKRWSAGYGVKNIVVGVIGIVIPFVVLVVWGGGAQGTPMSKEYVASKTACSKTAMGTEVCVAAEEKVQLPDVVSVVEDIEKRLGKSDKDFTSYLVVGGDTSSENTINFSLPFDYNVAFEIAAGYVPLDACQMNGSKELDFNYELVARASGIQEIQGNSTLTERTISEMTDEEFRNMYQENQLRIMKCEMTVDDYLDAKQ